MLMNILAACGLAALLSEHVEQRRQKAQAHRDRAGQEVCEPHGKQNILAHQFAIDQYTSLARSLARLPPAPARPPLPVQERRRQQEVPSVDVDFSSSDNEGCGSTSDGGANPDASDDDDDEQVSQQ